MSSITGIFLGPDYGWQAQALCAQRQESPEAYRKHADRFFGTGRPSKKMCAGCPVRNECLAHALEYDEPGIWGGTTKKERDLMRAEVPTARLRAMDAGEAS